MESDLFDPFCSFNPLSQYLWPASAWMGIQRECRAGGLQGAVLPCGLAKPGTDPHHYWPSGERVYHWGPGRVDGIWSQGPGCQRHWDGTLEPAGQREDKGVWWADILMSWAETKSLLVQVLQETGHISRNRTYFNVSTVSHKASCSTSLTTSV